MNVNKYKPLVLVILDGWGLSKTKEGNAIALAGTPVMDELMANYPHTQLSASGRDVGLPMYQDGNSESGHMSIGAGRVIEQDSVIISRSINNGTFFQNPVFLSALEHAKKNNSNLHLMGLLTGEQSAHADPDHLLALTTLLRLRKFKNIYLHLFTDGRDSYQYLSLKLLERLKKALINDEVIATIIGRFYAMDRNKEWKRTKVAYEALVMGKGIKVSKPEDAILQSYNRHENDEYLKPSVIIRRGKAFGRISDNDAVIFFNLRSDRVRQLTKAFTQPKFAGFKRSKVLKNLYFVTLTDFGPDLPGVVSAYKSRTLSNTLPFALKDLRQLYIAETEKYAHVTYFLNGGYDHPVAGEKRIIIESPHAYTYSDKPAMSAQKITDYVTQAINNKEFDFICLNYANPDMVAHTGNLSASIEAVKVIDNCLGQLKKVIGDKDGTMIITADHGNIEKVKDIETGQIDTAHSSSLVPFIIYNKNIPKHIKINKGALVDIAPTILHMINIKKPKEMGDKILCQYQINQQS